MIIPFFKKEKGNGAAGIAFIILCFAVGIFSIVVSREPKETDDALVVSKSLPHLNEVLSNQLSDTSSLEGLDRDIEQYLSEWHIHGASFSIMRNDSLLYSKGYGEADYGQTMTPGTILRVASVSKLITAAGIMTLCDRDSISLSDNVFGQDGLLCEYNDAFKDENYYDITVEHLLRHEAGFTTIGGDPMFTTADIMIWNHLSSPPDHEQLARIVLRRRLGFKPGTRASYSNFGYMLLSMIIEKVSGEDYEAWIKANVLEPAGCFDMHLGYNYYSERYANETRYFSHSTEEPVSCYDGSPGTVERCYGGNDIHALSGAGAWLASSAELCRFIASIDGDDRVKDILSKESIYEMTKFISRDSYGLGWNDISEDGVWTRTGTLSGTTCLIKNYPDGECWVLITNTGTWRGPRFANVSAGLFKRSREKYSSLLPDRNLFDL